MKGYKLRQCSDFCHHMVVVSVYTISNGMDKLQLFQSKYSGESKLKDLQPGWTVKIYQRIKEGEKTRVQAFEGMVIAKKHGNQTGGTITIRRVSDGIGVEKVFPVHLPSIEKVQVLKKPKVRRAKLYYLRDKTSREIKKKMKQKVVA